MLSLLIDFVNEYQEKQNKRQYIGNERMAEFQASFDEELRRIIDARIKAFRENDRQENNKEPN